MTMILGLSQLSYNWTFRVHMAVSHHNWLGEKNMATQYMLHTTQYMLSVSLSTSPYAYDSYIP
jgi:hypothetical protein